MFKRYSNKFQQEEDEREEAMRTRGGKGGGGAKQAAQLPATVPSFVPPPAQPGVSREVQWGPKPVAKPPGAVPSGIRNPASPIRTTGKGCRQKYLTFVSPPRPSATGRSTLLPTAPVEPPVTVVVPGEQVAQKRKGKERKCFI